ncbi:MAG: 50S ribosomal protein L22 [Chthoniobacterales bacterium]|nr:50S ribosomal protein L22 [Chthoniobacterales bacterium]
MKRENFVSLVSARKKSRANKLRGTVSVTLRNARITPRKLRLVLNEIKGLHWFNAERKLASCKRKSARILEKILRQAVHEAQVERLNTNKVHVVAGWVDSGITLKRIMPAAQGRAVPIRKKFSHVTLVLGEANA